LPGTLGGADSLLEESHTDGLLEYPQYTRPAEFRGWKVPDILLSGNHGEIARWRRQQRIVRTARRRPDLLDKALKQGSGQAALTDEEKRLGSEAASAQNEARGDEVDTRE
jgi:tRNA (guanine37-N1)-methyltransferase